MPWPVPDRTFASNDLNLPAYCERTPFQMVSIARSGGGHGAARCVRLHAPTDAVVS